MEEGEEGRSKYENSSCPKGFWEMWVTTETEFELQRLDALKSLHVEPPEGEFDSM